MGVNDWRGHDYRNVVDHGDFRCNGLRRQHEDGSGNIGRHGGGNNGHGHCRKGEGTLLATNVREQGAQEVHPLIVEVEVFEGHHLRCQGRAADGGHKVARVICQRGCLGKRLITDY